MSAEPFTVRVPDAVLDDLRERLARRRLPDDFGNEDWSYGFNGAYMDELLGYWGDGFDWRAQEAAINAYPQFRVELDDVPIHFIHVRGSGPDPAPLVLTHGWPWTFWDFHKVIGPLSDPGAHGGDPADAFDVIVPSLPGFGFSSPLRKTGVTHAVTADLWVRLMQDVLGYDRFAAHGSDKGVIVSMAMGHKYADRLLGIHVTGPTLPSIFNVDRPWADVLGRAVELRSKQGISRAALLQWERPRATHVAVHTVEPQTMAYGLEDSPAGLAAWLLSRRRSWSDCHGDLESVYTRDELLTHLTIYWVTRTIGTSMRMYKESADLQWQRSHDRTPLVEAPIGFSVFAPDNPPGTGWEHLPNEYDVRLLREYDRGGHFAAAERPDVIVTDIRDTFRGLR